MTRITITKEALLAATFHVSNDKERYYVRRTAVDGVHIEAQEDCVFVVATDGLSLYYNRQLIKQKQETSLIVNLSKDDLAKIKKDKEARLVQFDKIAENQVKYTCLYSYEPENAALGVMGFAEIIEATYPQWRNILPSDVSNIAPMSFNNKLLQRVTNSRLAHGCRRKESEQVTGHNAGDRGAALFNVWRDDLNHAACIVVAMVADTADAPEV